MTEVKAVASDCASALRRFYARFSRRLEAPVDMAWLAALRFTFGVAMAVSMLRFIAYGWIDSFFVKPEFHFKYWGFGWVEVLPPPLMHGLFWMLLVCATLMAVGWWFRAATVLFTIGFGYLQLVDVTTYLNHYYLAWLLCLLLALSPAGRVRWSVDAWRARSDARSRSVWASAQTVSFGWLLLFRFQVGVVYTYAGLAKAQRDWLLDAQPLSIWLGSHTDLPVIGPLFTWQYMPLLMSWAGFLFDTCIIWFLLWRRTRLFAYAAVLVFHTLTRTLFPIGMFSVIMVLAALVFFPPDWPRALASRLRRWTGRSGQTHEARDGGRLQSSLRTATSAGPTAKGKQWMQAWGVGIAIYCAFQLVMPMRFLFYGGDVRWHEQGMRFSWRVMVREKNGSVTFHVRDTATGRTFTVAPRSYLTRLQEREMSGQPDLILQLAHRIRDDYSARFGARVEVRAEALVSLNGRRLSPLIDPEIDLAAIQDGLAPYEWVLPAPAARPPRIRPV